MQHVAQKVASRRAHSLRRRSCLCVLSCSLALATLAAHSLEQRLRQLAAGVVGAHRGLDVRKELLHLLQRTTQGWEEPRWERAQRGSS